MKKLIFILLLLPLTGFSQLLLGVVASSGSTEVNIVDSLTASIVSIYELDEVNGTTVYDSYGANDGVNVDATHDQTPLINDGGRSYHFDGTNSYIDLNAMLVTSFPFSVSMFIKTDTTTQQHLFSSNFSAIGRYYGVTFDVTSTYLSVSYGDGLGSGASNRLTYIYNYTFEVDTIYHVLVTATSIAYADTKVYVNGSEVSYSSGSGTATAVSWTSGETLIGHRWNTYTYKFMGYIDQVIIFNAVATAGDISFLNSQKN